MRIDYKKLKKIHEDENHTVLQHSRGHIIKIAHSGVSPDIREQLKAIKMNEGGVVTAQDEQRKRVEESFKGNTQQQPSTEEQNQNHRTIQKSMHRNVNLGLPNGMADGGEVQPWEMPQDEPIMSRMPQQAASEDQAPPPQQSPSFADVMGQPDQTIIGNQQRGSVVSEQPTLTNPPLAQPQQNQPLPSLSNGVVGAIGQQQAGIKQEAAAIGAQGKQEASAAQEHMMQQQQLMKDTEAKGNAIMQELDNVRHDYANGHIDPDHFITSKSSLGKISTAIGLILGGISGGVLHQENPALKFLNAQIDRDVEAQKAEMGRKQNLMTVLNQQYGNMKDASNMARAIQLDMYKSKLDMAAAQSKDPIAKARAMQSGAILEQQKQALVGQTAQRQAVLQGLQNGSLGPEHAVNVLVPEKQRAEAFKELKTAREAQSAMTQIESAMRQVQKLQSTSNRAMSPIQSKSQIDALNLQIGALGKDIFGRLNEQELKMLENSHVKYTDDANSVNVKIKNLQNIMSKHMDSPLLEAYGIKLPKKTGFTPR